MSYSKAVAAAQKRVCKADEKAVACITAISGNTTNTKCLQPHYIGEDIYVNKNYIEFRPYEPEMNQWKKKQKLITPHDEKTSDEIGRLHEIHYTFKKNQYGFKTDFNNYKIVEGKLVQLNPPPERTDLENAQLAAQLHSQSRLYIKKRGSTLSQRTKRGIITKVSRSAATRLKKFLASLDNLALWIDFTFPDDVMMGKTLAERRDFANECLKKLKRYLHSLGLQEVWKKEFTDRKSGKLKGLYVPHYHIALTGLSRHQEKIWQALCIQILYKWVKIIGSDDDNAVPVACHKNSFRRIQSSRQAIAYIGKYFSKTNEVANEEGEVISIGRAWGYAQPLKDGIPDPHHFFLTRQQSIQFRRFMRRYKRLKRHKKGFIGVYEQIINGYSTYMFAHDDTALRFLKSIGVNLLHTDGIPF